MEGQILGNRYELLEKIGGGGMALVYKAKCKLLNRFVAVKILRPEFTNDEEFVKRFRIEAQAAASLSHPNIVSIYDVGHEGSIYYIVMEYIDGVTLKQYITERGRLGWREAVNISIQICSAIEHAHRNHIVHRDIKPHNIMITRDGIAKVTDFGIARAVSSSTITMVGSTIGSVHYFSPEQARGGFTDEKSDLYSLGIGLYEMVTGRLPFDGDTPVAVALKHIQLEAEQPIDIESSIPEGVNDIILKAMKKEQNKRYQSASEMLQDLYKVLKEPDGRFVAVESIDDYPTRRVQAVNSEMDAGDRVNDRVNKVNDKINDREDYLIEEEPGEKKRKGDKLTIPLAVFTSLVIMAVCVYIGIKLVIPTIMPEPPKEFVVKNYVDRNINDVKDELSKAGIDIKPIRKSNEKVAKDIIVSQNPEPGKTFKLGASNVVELEVSDGPQLVKITDLRKVDYRTAENKISDMGLIPKTEEMFSDNIGIGLVIKTDPEADEEVKPGTVVTIYKSKGPELKPTKVPDLIGKTGEEAKRMLADAKLKLGKISPEEGKNYIDKIIKQEPAPQSEVSEDTPVNIYFDSSIEQRKSVTRTLNLSNPETYGDKIKVQVEITPSDTKKAEVIVNEEKKKSDFPITLTIPVPDKGKTDINVTLDGKPYVQFTEDLSGR